jgi:hypothetical protein
VVLSQTFISIEPVDRKQLGNRRVGANEGAYLGEEQRDTSMLGLQICPYRGEKRLSGLWVIRAIKKGRGGPSEMKAFRPFLALIKDAALRKAGAAKAPLT